MTSRPVTVLILMRVGAVRVWSDMVGKRSDMGAAPRKRSLRGRFATDKLRNVVHAAESAVSAEQSISFFFSEVPLYPVPTTDYMHDYIFCKRAAFGRQIEQ